MLFRSHVCLSLCLCTAFICGCKTWNEKPLKSFKDIATFDSEDNDQDEKDESATTARPAKVIAIWKEATLGANGKTIRGFAGRVYFFDRADNPVKVDGDLIVYGFDDSDDLNARETADKKFVTKSEDLARKHSVSDVGSSYSVWLPWDEVGGYRKNISLLTMFKGADGSVVRGEPTQNYLPGRKPEVVAEQEEFLRQFRKTVRSGVAPASYETGVADGDNDSESGKKMRTTSITIPKQMSQRLGIGGQTANSGETTTSPTLQPVDQTVESSSTPTSAAENILPEAARISTTMPTDSRAEKRNAFRRIPVTPIGHD